MEVCLRDIASIENALPLRAAIDADPGGTHVTIQAKDIDADGRLRLSSLVRFTPSSDATQYRVGAADVVLTTRSRYDAAVVEGLSHDTIAAGSLYILRADVARVHPPFLVWYLRHPDTQAALRSRQSGVSIPFLRLAELAALPISLPSIATQRAIAEIDGLRQREVDLSRQIADRRATLLNHALMNQARGN